MTDGSGKQLSIEIILGDCLEAMAGIPAGSVDLICADLPFQVTACSWDSLIPFEPLWQHYRRLIKPNGAVILFGVQPFTSALIMSNPKWFRYCLVWDKVNRKTGVLNANKMPLKRHEDIAVFYKRLPAYNPQMTPGRPVSGGPRGSHSRYLGRGEYNNPSPRGGEREMYPCSIVAIPAACGPVYHPTQKPVALLEYLIRTYTDPGETVLDSCMGSGTTGVACLQTGRNFIGIERDASYYEIARRRIADAQAQLTFTDGSGDESV